MTLSLDDVRNKRFRMARKSGYEVLEVDEFVDEIEESFAQLLEENQNLKKQVEALRVSPAEDTPVAAPPSEEAAPIPEPETPAPVEASALAAPVAPSEKIVVTTAKEASSAVVRLVELYTEQAEQLVGEANEEAARIRQQASSSAERVESAARANAERVNTQVLSRTDQLDREIAARRAEMLSNLESQREQLSSSISALRSFEATYRANLVEHLRGQLVAVESGKAEPSNAPALFPPTGAEQAQPGSPGQGDAASQNSEGEEVPGQEIPAASETPRLDALLGDQR